MKILHVNTERPWRGGERQTLLLATTLQSRGITNAIACRRNSPLEEKARERGISTIKMPGDPVRASFAIGSVAREYDLIHCHTGRGHSLAAAVAFWHGKPVIVTRRVIFVPKQSRFNRYKYHHAARVVCISHAIAGLLGEWGVPAAQLTVIHDAIPMSRSSEPQRSVEELRAKLEIPTDRRVVGCIGALTAEKDHATFLRAAHEIAAKRKEVVFVVIGEGKLKSDLLRLRHELGLDEVVCFTGFLPEADRYLDAFDVFVLSSRAEGLGSSLLDAFAAGIPVVATSVGGIPELVRHEETGLLVPVGDAPTLARAIERLLDDRALADKVTMAARRKVEQDFSVERMANSYQALYEAVLAGKP